MALDISRSYTALSASQANQSARLACDFLPDTKAEVLEDDLRRVAAADGKRQIAGLLAEQLPRRLVEALLIHAQVNPELRAAELTRQGRAAVVKVIKGKEIAIHGTRGFAKAEVTAGGVSLAEVDSRTMESKLVPGIYFAGEILDLDGPIGGYNFQAAFSTGVLAGRSA